MNLIDAEKQASRDGDKEEDKITFIPSASVSSKTTEEQKAINHHISGDIFYFGFGHLRMQKRG